MRKIKTTAALALFLATCGVVRADVLESLPADALVAVKVANLAKTSDKIAKLSKDLGVDAFVQQLQNPLANLKAQIHVEKGINDQGEIGFAYLSPKTAGVSEDDAFVVLIPVSAYADFLSNFGDAKTEGGVSEVSSPDGSGKTLYVADWSGYAAISPAKAMVAKPTATLKPSAIAAKEAGRQDFLLYANFKTLSLEAMPNVDKGLATVLEKLDGPENKDLDEKYKPLVKAVVNQAFAAAKTFLNDADAATVGLNITPAGINTTVLSDFKADSYLGKMASSLKGTDQPLTIGLPAMKYLAYGGSMFDPKLADQLITDLIGPIKAEALKLEGHDDIKKAIASLLDATKATTGTVFGLPVPTKIGQEGLFQTMAAYRGGAKDYQAAFDEGATLLKQKIAEMKQPETGAKPSMAFVQNAKSVEGVSFSNVKFDVTLPEGPMAQQQQMMMNLFYGPNGLAFDYGLSGNDFLVSQGVPDETLGSFIKSLKSGEDNFSKLDYIKAVDAELPKTRSLVYYVALDEIVNVGVATAAQFNFPIQVQLPPELPPLGIAVGTDGPSLRIDAHLPTSTLQSLIAAGIQASATMRGGNGGNL